MSGPHHSGRRARGQRQSPGADDPRRTVAAPRRRGRAEDVAIAGGSSADGGERRSPGAVDRAESPAGDYLFKNVRGEPIEAANFYDLFRDTQRALEITPLRDLYSAKDTYLSLALTNGVSLTWLSEQTGVAVATILKHYGRFIHSSETDDFELAKIENPVQFEHRFEHRSDEKLQVFGMKTSTMGFVPYYSRVFAWLAS